MTILRPVTFAAVAALLAGAAAASEPDSVELAADLQNEGHTVAAEAVLRRLAEAGDTTAMERLGVWHLYGERLLGPGPWHLDEARRWLALAARRGSSVARHLMPSATHVARR